ncbi:MAG: hypothetical protein Ct9H300mP1_19160 [Planctomycetaceae bacterium]|nr:MAG: hypothetical protein Ct9H300mP1_19160 [Planctomycetaceae bacterium]
MAHSKIVWVPPPLPPVTPIRFGSTSGSPARKSRPRKRVPGLQAHDALQPQFGLGLMKPQPSGLFM